MNPREAFGLGVRLFGIWLVCRTVPYLASFLDLKLFPPSDKARDGASAHLIYATLDLSLAAFFLLWTRVVVSWSFDEPKGAGLGPAGDEAGRP